MARECPYQNCDFKQLSNDDRSCPSCGRPIYSVGGHDFTEIIVDRTRDFTGREWVFAEIDRWLADPKGARVFFLSGGPGSGKSAVAARLVQLVRGKASADVCPHLVQTGLAYYHFCQAQFDAVIEPLGFVKSLSLALADRYPAVALALTQIGPRHPEIHVQQMVGQATGSEITAVKIGTLEVGGLSARKAFAYLAREPLETLAQSGETGAILILVDALDEALPFDQDDNLVTLLADVTDDPRDLPNQVRILVTSRPDPRVVDLIGKPARDLIDNAPDSQRDVRDYAEHRLTPVLAEPAARQDLAERIAAAGAGNFLYARYVLDDLLQHPADPVTLVLPAGLRGVYEGFLKREVGRQGRTTWRTYRPLLGALVMARGSGLTRGQLAGIMEVRASTVEELLEPCMQYLGGTFPAGPFRIYHQSFRDFLLESEVYRLAPDEVRDDLARYFWAQYAVFRDEGAALDDYTLANLPAHLVEAGRNEDLRTLHFDYGWLQAKLDRLGINALLADFSLGPPAEDEATRRLGRALEQAAYVLAQDPAQLASQLLGRLLHDKDGGIHALLAQAHKRCPRPCLLPQTASLWETDALMSVLTGHASWVNGLAVSPDGTRVISAAGDSYDNDNTLKVWNLDTGNVLRTLQGHDKKVNAVAVMPDGTRVVSASSDRTLKVWDLDSGEVLRTLSGHEEEVNAVAALPDGTRVVSASSDRTLKVWDLDSGDILRTLSGHTKAVRGVAVTCDGKRVVSASSDWTLKVWDLDSGEVLRTLAGHEESLRGVAVTPDGRRAVSASKDQTLKVWDLDTGNALHTLTGHQASVRAVAITSDGHQAVSASEDHTLKVWNLDTAREERSLEGHTNWVRAVAVTPDSQLAISGSRDKKLRVWNLASDSVLPGTSGHTLTIYSVAVTPDGKRVVSASLDKTLIVWDVDTGNVLSTLLGHEEEVNSVAVTPDGGRAVSASDDRTLKVWDLASGTGLYTLAGHAGKVLDVAVTPDGRRAISASADNTLKVWDLTRVVALHTLTGHTLPVEGVAVMPDGRRAVSASKDQTLKVWDLDTGNALHTLTGHQASVRAVAITSDGHQAVSASEDHTLKVWNLDTGREVRSLQGHTNWVRGVAVTRDGRFVVSASRDETVKVWDLVSGVTVATLRADGGLHTCVVAPDNMTIVAGGDSGRMHLLRWEQ